MILAAGTSYHAGVVGRYVLEEWARVPVEPDIASEWIYRNPVVDEKTLVIGISQSGETRDTIEAMKLAREKGAHTVAITNMMGSQITREVDSVLYTRCGLEVSVASSKTFTSQVALFYLIGLKLAQVRETMPPEEIEFILDQVYELPGKLARFLDADHPIDEERHLPQLRAGRFIHHAGFQVDTAIPQTSGIPRLPRHESQANPGGVLHDARDQIGPERLDEPLARPQREGANDAAEVGCLGRQQDRLRFLQQLVDAVAHLGPAWRRYELPTGFDEDRIAHRLAHPRQRPAHG